ncbi:ATP-dependent RecD-like DNA helicase [Acholeplasma equirhinis]|uniref:SF1B family DNA helicase RecD2 n=1 Tax=Acholeplasma equirhinis TaxID=555393 RepID=UPI00197AC274|nr:ATP-dependent RecD-like DNA helicase [Acholeplasma equirhinis]MBN3490304.1 ATP-dependent RecD-like DNA helicase [Acholeplasma equirhinis]
MSEKVKGYIKSYIYRNDENGYVIAKLETDNKENLTIVGYFPLLNEEIMYEFTGELTNHIKYGKQFKVESWERLVDTTESGLVRYLSSDDFSGIGPKTAEKIVDLLGMDAVKLIIEDADVLAPILNPIKRVSLRKTLIEKENEYRTYVALNEYELSQRIIRKLYTQYGNQTLDIINQDPFRLMYEVDRIGFIKAAGIAEKIGIPKDDIRTVKAAITHILKTTAASEGNLYVDYDELKLKTDKLLNLELDYKEAIEDLISEKRIIEENGNYFLKSIHWTEIEIAKKVRNFIQKEKRNLDKDLLDLLLTQIAIQKSIDYTERQREAILEAMVNPISIITGGPGTGKTTLIDGLLSLYASYHKINLKNPDARDQIALMAPTGRAAKRMKEILKFEARTIHSHLGIYDLENNSMQYGHLIQDLIIVDEASMIDIFLAERLISAIHDDAQIIIVGDEDQLPSVGPGNVLADLIASNQIPVIRLNEIHRQAKDSHIIKLAREVNNQNLTNEEFISHQDVIFYNGDAATIKRVIINQIKGAIEKGYDLIEDIQVLIPQYKGDLGIDVMNHEIQKNFNKNYQKGVSVTYGDKTYYEGDKVIQLLNDNEKHIMNGDIGVVEKIFKNEKGLPVLQIKFDETVVFYEQSDLENLNLAYVISIHKSQGSEYKIVFLPIMRSYLHMLKKELIYTAITRAKKFLFIMGDMNLLKYAANQLVETRRTKLKDRLLIKDNSIFDLDVEEDLEDEDPTAGLSPYDFMN